MIVLWGSNARETHPIFFHHVLKAVHNGARLFVVDPRRTASAKWADTWLGTRRRHRHSRWPARSSREIIHSGLCDEQFIRRATEGYRARTRRRSSRTRSPRASG